MHIWDALKNPTSLFDSHCHINAEEYNSDLDNVLADLASSEVDFIYDISVSTESSKRSIELAKSHHELQSFIGIDPEAFIPGSNLFLGFENGAQKIDEDIKEIRDLVRGNVIKGIGEIGLDFYWIKDKSKEEQNMSIKLQKELYTHQLKIAEEFSLPVSIHSRSAEFECFEILNDFNVTGIFHSYTGNYETAKMIIDKGYGLGINGIITFKNADELRNVYRKILGNKIKDWAPEDFYRKGIFFETDGPFLSPEGKRGERNIPSNVEIIFNKTLQLL